MKCNRCGNEEMRYFYQDKSVWYCRKCIGFGRVDVGSYCVSSNLVARKIPLKVKLDYPLSNDQLKAIAEIRKFTREGRDVLVYAATGAGKTELVMDSIATAISNGLKVGFAISRRSVVLEIAERMQSAFSKISVIAVCEGHTKIVDADLIICTMHQLYRYPHTFDLLIMDEVDAFPYINNSVLEHIAMHSCRGTKIYLTATPDPQMLAKAKNHEIGLVTLFSRPHHKPLVVPQIVTSYDFILKIKLFSFIRHCHQMKIPLLVFVPTIEMANRYYLYYRLLYKCAAFTSKSFEKDPIISAFRRGEYDCLFTTTILERGITVQGVYIAIMKADHRVFNEASLVQIVGRVGRKIAMPSGIAMLFCNNVTEAITNCVSAIKEMNKTLK